MRRYLIIGAGMQGVAAGYYLAKNDECEVVFNDLDVKKAEAAAKRVHDLTGKPTQFVLTNVIDIMNDYHEEVMARLSDYDGVLSAATFKINEVLTEYCAKLGVHMVDLGGNTRVVQHQIDFHTTAINSEAVIVADSGLAPGLGNILADLIHSESGADSVEILCGGIPEIGEFNLSDPLKYKLVFSYEGLINEYFEPVYNLQNGQLVVEDGFSGLDSNITMEFDGKTYELEAFYTSGGTSMAPFDLRREESDLKNYVYKTLRYRGHRDAFAEMFHSDRDQEIMSLIKNDWKDIILLRVQGKKDGQVVQEIAMRTTECPVTGFSAMEQSTAFPAAQTLIMAATGALESGVWTPNNAFYGRSDLIRLLMNTTGLKFEEKQTVSTSYTQDMFGP